MKRALLLALAPLVAAAADAAVFTSVEPRLLDELDSIALTIRATGQTGAQPLDLSALEKDFEILRSDTQSQFRAINGQVEAWVEYQISLRPRRPGELVIPAIDVDGEASEAIPVVVRPLDAKIRQTLERMVFFRTDVAPNPVYVQAQSVLTRHLYYSAGVQIYSDLPGLPEVANAVVIPFGDTRTGTTTLDGRTYGVVEQRFAIFPEQSGELVIPEASITASVRLPAAGGGRTRRSGIRVRATGQQLDVLPVPRDYPADQPWLPATDVRIDETWSPGVGRLTVGTPARRQLTVTASGNSGSSIPPLHIEHPDSHFKWYPDKPVINDHEQDNQIAGERVESYSLIPVHPGGTLLPGVSLTWWDTSSRTLRVARLPERQLLIGGSLPTTDAAPVHDANAAAPRPPATQSEPASPEARGGLPNVLIWLSITAAVVALIYLGTRHHTFRRLRRQAGHERQARNRAWSTLKRACRDENPANMRRALLALIQAVHVVSEQQAQAFVHEVDDARVWQRLNTAVWARHPGATVTGEEVMRLATKVRQPRAQPQDDRLPGLFA